VIQVKTGAILYIMGQTEIDEEIDPSAVIKNLGIQADKVVVVSATSSHEDIQDAWWMLLARGMKRVLCLFVATQDGATFRLAGQPLRLCG